MIFEQARQLGQAIKNSEAARKLERSQSRLTLDPAAQQILQELQQLQRRIQLAEFQGIAPSMEDQTAAQNLDLRLKSNDTLKQLFEAQEEFQLFMAKVNEAIAEGMAGGGASGSDSGDNSSDDSGPKLIVP